MPSTLGFFGMSLECIGNVRYGKRDKHFTLGDMRFVELLRTRLKPYKLNAKTKSDVKQFEKLILDDIHLIHVVRNAYYGHSLLHLDKDRLLLTNALKDWYLRSGHGESFTDISFKKGRVDDDIAREAHGLFKVGLRTSRMFIFMLLGYTRSIPFASHDYLAIGDMRDGEVLEYRGIKYWSS